MDTDRVVERGRGRQREIQAETINSRVCEGKITDPQALRQKSHEIQSRFKREDCVGEICCAQTTGLQHGAQGTSLGARGGIYMAGE